MKSCLEMQNELEWKADEILLAQYTDVSETEKEQLLQQIHEELLKNGDNANGSFTKPFVNAVTEFIKHFSIAFGKISVLDLIDELMDLKEYFVTPGDLYENCTNATVIGELHM